MFIKTGVFIRINMRHINCGYACLESECIGGAT